MHPVSTHTSYIPHACSATWHGHRLALSTTYHTGATSGHPRRASCIIAYACALARQLYLVCLSLGGVVAKAHEIEATSGLVEERFKVLG